MAGHIRHGQSKSRLYKAWAAMKYRCENPKNTAFPYYGGRGIKVCVRWQTFENFVADMGTRPPNATIERKNPNGNYTPKNCIWATRKEQQRNRRITKRLTIGRKTKTISEWIEDFGIERTTFFGRLDRGWNPREALTKPIDSRFQNGRKKHGKF